MRSRLFVLTSLLCFTAMLAHSMEPAREVQFTVENVSRTALFYAPASAQSNSAPGDYDDRDLKFFDAVLARLKQDYRVDAKRIYATGHSNGGGFSYLLWLTRGDVFAAVAPCAAVAKYAAQLKPKPAMHIAGEKDPLVKFTGNNG